MADVALLLMFVALRTCIGIQTGRIQRVRAARHCSYRRRLHARVAEILQLKARRRSPVRWADRGRPRRRPHFDVLGDRPSCHVTGALNSATVDDSLQQSCPDHELSAINDRDDNVESPPPPLGCSSPAPSSTSSGEASSERGKMKRDSTSELVTYLERADERFLQQTNDMDDAMRRDTQSLLGLMGRMVAVMEAQVQT